MSDPVQLVRSRVRLKLVEGIVIPVVDALTGVAPAIARAVDCQFELGLYVGGAIIASKANIASLAFRIAGTSINKTIAAVDVDVSLSDSDWAGGAKQNVLVQLTGAELQFDFAASIQASQTFFLSVAALTNDTPARRYFCGCALLTVVDVDAAGDLDVGEAGSPAFRVNQGNLELWDSTAQAYKPVWLDNDALVIGPPTGS